MILKVYDLLPGFSPILNGFYHDGPSTRPESLGRNYSFIVGIRTKPTNRDRERIERAIAKAWEGIFDPQGIMQTYRRKVFPPSYGVAIVPDGTPLSGETALPQFFHNHYYIVFALLESDSTVSEEEEREVSESITRAIENQVRDMKIKPRIGVVTLYNCSVEILEGMENE